MHATTTKTFAYACIGTEVCINGVTVEQLVSVLLDWTAQRVRIRGVWAGGKLSGQNRLQELLKGESVSLRIAIPKNDPMELAGTVISCRTRLNPRHVILFTADFRIPFMASKASDFRELEATS